MKMSYIFYVFILFSWNSSFAQSKNIDTLYKNFLTPPSSAYPRVWWHWMNGNITKSGIRKDLNWMKQVGIGGFQNFDAAWATPQIVKKRLAFMTPDWIDAFKLATKLADSLKLEMAISSSPGWSESGGPWVKPKDGMKKIVWSETYIKGDGHFTGTITPPPSTTGEFQNLSIMMHGSNLQVPTFYKDIAVVAYKLPGNNISQQSLNAQITSSAGHFDLEQLTDGDIACTNTLPVDSVTKTAWIQFEFAHSQTVKSITIASDYRDRTVNSDRNQEKGAALQISDDGIDFHSVCLLSPGRAAQQTVSFEPVSGKFFRVLFDFKSLPNEKEIRIAELKLYPDTRINRFEDKAGFAVATQLYANLTPATGDATALNNVIDLTDKLTFEGKLNWTPPAGNWDIIRFGYSLIGTTNHPASPEATGLEVDKMDSSAVAAYLKDYLQFYSNATGGLIGKKGLGYIVTDSWEAGAENWTSKMSVEFKKRRGYDILPWMPVLAGHIVKGSAESESFLWDFRKTLSELVAQYYYDELSTLLHSRGMKRYSESHEVGRALIADGMDVKRTADIPMSAMWTPSVWSGPAENYESDVLESASVAHVYRQNLVAAESWTAFGNAWSWSPEKLKPTADLELSCGLNRFVIHTSVHQPTDDKIPGLGLGPFGQWFNRHETWAYEAKPWMTYLSRSCYMLQQGKFVADVIYYYGEDTNITALFRHKLPDVPEGYHFDFVNSDALLNLLSVKNKEIITSSGMKYKVLALDSNTRYMPLKVLKKLKELVDAGAVVAGPKPIATPSLADDKGEFNRIADQLWDQTNTTSSSSPGRIFTGLTLAQVLDTIKVKPDFNYSKPDADSKLLYIHRHLPGREIYWVNNRTDKERNIDCIFRLAGKTVEIWHPETGTRELNSYEFTNGETKVPLHLLPNDAVFVIFSGNTKVSHKIIAKLKQRPLFVLKGLWKLNFQKDRGAPETINIKNLTSWTESNNDGIKYFSGTGTYIKTINVPIKWVKNKRQTWIDLGNVKDVAEVIINSKPAGIIWNNPFKTEITGLLKPGKNNIQIKVTNLWVNRLIGDQQVNNDHKFTYTTEKFYEAKSPLLISGLLGPVTIFSTENK